MSVTLVLSSPHTGQTISIPISYCSDPLLIHCTYPAATDSEEILAAAHALSALRAYVEDTADEGHFPITYPQYVFSSTDELKLANVPQKTPSETTYTTGTALHLVICYVHHWRRLQLTRLQMAAIFLEELLHCAYCIFDETEVKHKVVEILRYTDANITIETLYGSLPGKVNFT